MRPWGPIEIELLKELAEENVADLAQLFSRTVADVVAKKVELGLARERGRKVTHEKTIGT